MPGLAQPMIEAHAYELRTVDPDDAPAVAFHQPAELHILDDIRADGGMPTQALVDVSPEEQKGAERAGDERRPAPHHKPQRQHGRKGERDRRQQQGLGERADLQTRNHRQQAGVALLGNAQRDRDAVQGVDRLGIHEQQPLTRRRPSELRTGERFAVPVWGERAAGQQTYGWVAPRQPGDDGGGLVFAVIVQHKDLAVGIVLPRQRLDTARDRTRFVARGDEDRDQRAISRRERNQRPAQQT